MAKYTFSGHESFQCKTHWLKRGYDFINSGYNFSDEDSVVKLGVGKNMVASIRFWMKAFGLIDQNNILTQLARKIFDSENGLDPFLEDAGSLWLLHFSLINTEYATIYHKTFVDYHCHRNIIDKTKLQNYIKHVCFDDNALQNQYNENTIKRDIAVMIHNYSGRSIANIEDTNTLLAPLNLLQEMPDGTYLFNNHSQNKIPCHIFLYALLVKFQDSKSISFESMQELALMFCLTNNDLQNIIIQLCKTYSNDIVFSDVAGIKELQFKHDIATETAINNYYLNEE